MLFKINHHNSLAEFLYGKYDEDDDWNYYSSYQPIIDYFGQVLVQVDDNDYQGDTRVLLRDGRFGILIIGWGSCSGCDALQCCDSAQDLYELISSLESSIKWFDTLEEVKAYVASDTDRETEYYYHQEGWDEFKEKVLAL